MKIRRLPRAILDVDEIWDWVAAQDIEAADRLIEWIAKAAARWPIFRKVGVRAPSSAKVRAASWSAAT